MCIDNMLYMVLGTILRDLGPKVKAKGKKSGYLRWCTIDCSLVWLYIAHFHIMLNILRRLFYEGMANLSYNLQ